MRPSRPTRGLPTSRAYWELKAEQMMNRVFAPEDPIDLDPLPQGRVGEEGQIPHPHRALTPVSSEGSRVLHTANRGPTLQDQKSGDPTPLTVLLLAALGGVGLVGALSSVVLMQQWTGFQKTLSQERNLLLVERLRALGPATIPAPTPVASTTTPPAPRLDALQPIPSPHSEAAGLPPPPPEEPWMEQLKDLPIARTLPVVSPSATRTPSPSPPSSSQKTSKSMERFTGPLPQLVGLVGAPGQAGSAIFQVGETSTNVNVGEQIGSSGWKLSAADAESALIERGTEVRRIAIVTGG